MDRAIVSALAAILGSLVGGAATIATAWLTQRTQGRRASIDAEVRKREALYVEFITEGSKVLVEGFRQTAEEAPVEFAGRPRVHPAPGPPRGLPPLPWPGAIPVSLSPASAW